jgi:hypothetical protein
MDYYMERPWKRTCDLEELKNYGSLMEETSKREVQEKLYSNLKIEDISSLFLELFGKKRKK